MSETGWTLETLKALMDERDRRYDEVATAKQEAVRIALSNAEKASLLAEANSQRWRDNANEWRKAMNDREANFLHKNMGLVIGMLSVLALLLTVAGKIVE